MSGVISANISCPIINLSTIASTTPSADAPAFSQNELMLITAALTTIFVIGSSQNLAVVFAVLLSRNRLMDIPSSWFVLSLATADLLVCGVSVPLYIVHLHMFFWEPFLAFGQLTTLVSSSSLVLLTFNRFLSIFDTLGYLRRMTLRRAQMVALGMWIVALLLTTVSSMGKMYNIEQLLYPAFAYYAVINVFTGGFHLYMFRKAWMKIRAIKNQHLSVMSGQDKTLMREFRYFFRLFIVVGTYIITWIPFITVLTSTPDAEERKSHAFQRRFALFYTLLSINSAIDPLIYFLRSDEFKRFTKKIRPLLLIRSSDLEQGSRGNAFHIATVHPACNMDPSQNL